MTWLYVPSDCLASAPASEDSTSASASLDPTRAASLSWRGKQAQPQAWLRAWKRGGFIRLLSGLTCEPSTLDDGVERWIASFRETPAKGTASLESDLVTPTTDGYSTAPLTYSTPAGLILSSARTSSGTSSDNSRSLYHHWKGWAVALRREYSARPRLVPVTDANDCSSWPTAKVSTGAYSYSQGNREKPVMNLQGAAEMWPTITVRDFRSDLAGEKTSAEMYQGKGMPLSRMAEVEWRTPVADDTGTRTTRYKQGGMALSMQAAQWPTPMAGSSGTDKYNAAGNSDFSRKAEELAKGVRAFVVTDLLLPDRPTPSGVKSSETRRRLNPLFVEWLMGWPEGLSGFDTVETGLSHWWQAMRGELLRLVSPKRPADGQGSLFDG